MKESGRIAIVDKENAERLLTVVETTTPGVFGIVILNAD